MINQILRDRLDNLLPRLMRETGIDMWLVINREYVEDPVYLTLVPEPVFHARRLSMLVFFDRGEEERRRAADGEPLSDGGLLQRRLAGRHRGEPVEAARGDHRRAQSEEDRHQHEPEWSFGDGLTAGLHASLMEALGPEPAARVTSAEKLCVRWLETRTPLELDLYTHMVAIARGVVVGGVLRARHHAGRHDDRRRGVVHPAAVHRSRPGDVVLADVDRQRAGGDVRRRLAVLRRERRDPARRRAAHRRRHHVSAPEHRHAGDGLRAASGETDVPEGLKRALAAGNRWQDLLTDEFVVGRTGNDIFARTDAAAKKEGIAAQHVHASGRLPRPRRRPDDRHVGQPGRDVPVTGEWPLAANTAYAIEGNVKVAVPEWNGQLVQIKLEQTALFDGTRVIYCGGTADRVARRPLIGGVSFSRSDGRRGYGSGRLRPATITLGRSSSFPLPVAVPARRQAASGAPAAAGSGSRKTPIISNAKNSGISINAVKPKMITPKINAATNSMAGLSFC